MKDKIPKEDIEKWLLKLKRELKYVKANDDRGKELLKNIKAYVYDTEYFLKENDYVKAWEAVSFAWGLFEAGVDLEKLMFEECY